MARRCRSCGCCLWLYHDWDLDGLGTIPDPEPDDWAGNEKIRVVGSATYSEPDGRILLPDATAGIVSTEELLTIEHGFVACRLWLPQSVGPGGIPAGARYRMFFEGDAAEENYVYCDIEKYAAPDPEPSAYVNEDGYWIVTLGKRTASIDLSLAWCMVDRAIFDAEWWIVLTRHSCHLHGEPDVAKPAGCHDGYAVHVRAGEHLLRGDRSGPWSHAFSSTPNQTPENAYAGATIHLALHDPPGRYFGVRRMDSVPDLELPLWIIAAGRTDVPNSTTGVRKCIAPDFSSHNACDDPTPRRTTVEIESLTDESDRRWPMYAGPGGDFILQETGMTPTFPSTEYVIRQFSVFVTPKLRSNKPGETDWMSQGEDDPRLDLQVVCIEMRSDDTVFYQIDTHYQYVWEVSIEVDGDSLDCNDFVLSLDPADATVTDLMIGGSVRDPMDSLLTIGTTSA